MLISILIPTYNEIKYIRRCLESILNNDFPKENLEILIIDGGSSDGTIEVVNDYTKKYKFIKVLTNPRRYQVFALNLGIKEAKGDIVIRMDAHTEYDMDYISKVVELLITRGVGSVGGKQYAVGEGYVGKCIAIALNSPFGVGNAKFRYSLKEEFVDTVYLGAWYKRTLEEVGGFNEDWLVNEDYELNYRLRKKGYKILYSPEIRCKYYVRNSLKAFAKQYFRYGFWKVKTLTVYPDSLQVRQLVPPIFVLSLVFSIIFIILRIKLGFVVPGVYFAINFFYSVKEALKREVKCVFLTPFVFFIMHFSWGIGFIIGLFKWGIPKINFKIIKQAISGYS